MSIEGSRRGAPPRERDQGWTEENRVNPKRIRIRWILLAAAAAAVALGAAACSDSATKPKADEEVEIQTARFFPAQVNTLPGRKVLWVNVIRKGEGSLRTVTSGKPTDPDSLQGLLFDVELDGFASGDPFGDTYLHTFTERDTIHYFSRYPVGAEYTGRIIVE